MRLLDLFCCEGGASTGYARAGFDVFGVDLFRHRGPDGKLRGYRRERYPFPALQGDCLDVLRRLLAGEYLPFTHPDGTPEDLCLADFDALAASPPCQAYSVTRHSHSNVHPDLVAPTRELLLATGLPYIMENVEGAPLVNPVTLCGSEFALRAHDPALGETVWLRRHRLFEAPDLLLFGNGGCRHPNHLQCAGAYGGGSVDRGHAKDVRRGGYTPGQDVRAALIGCDWMTQAGLSQAIPPAYTEHLGAQLLDHLAP